MEATTLVGFVVSMCVPKLLEILKSKRWAPFIQHYAPFLNLVTASVVALITALGVTVHFDAAAGVLTVGGLMPGQLLETGLTWVMNWAIQEVVYRKFINDSTPASKNMRRGGLYVLPLLLAIGLSSSACASLGPRVGHSLVVAETAIHDAIGITVETGNRLCSSHILDAPRCVQFNEKLLPVLREARAFNQAVYSNTAASIPDMVIALDHLVDNVVVLMPTAEDRAAVIAKINNARALLRSFRGGK